MSSVGLYVKAGARADPVPGTAFVHSRVAFGGTHKRTATKLVRDVERVGGKLGVAASREVLGLNATVMREAVPAAVDALAETLLQPRLDGWLVREAAGDVAAAAAQAHTAQAALVDALHTAAFGIGGAMANPVAPAAGVAGKVTVENVREYLANVLAGGNVALVGTNVEHAALADVADMFLAGLVEGSKAAPAAEWHGGVVNVHTEAPEAHCAVAVKVPGQADAKATAAAGILQIALAYKLADAQFNMTPIFAPGSDVGLFGVAATTGDHNVPEAMYAAHGVLAEAGKWKDEDIANAAAVYKMNLISAWEGASGCGAAGSANVLGAGASTLGAALEAANKVTAKDIASVVESALKCKPAVAVLNSGVVVPFDFKF